MYPIEPSAERDVLDFVNEIPRAFIRLTVMAERLFADFGVGAPGRSLLRDLFLEGALTAPELARRRPVTRQAIQPVLDDLAARGYVRAIVNPRHKRSNLYELTRTGVSVCVDIQERELKEIRRIVSEIDPAPFSSAATAIRTLNDVLAAELSVNGGSLPRRPGRRRARLDRV